MIVNGNAVRVHLSSRSGLPDNQLLAACSPQMRKKGAFVGSRLCHFGAMAPEKEKVLRFKTNPQTPPAHLKTSSPNSIRRRFGGFGWMPPPSGRLGVSSHVLTRDVPIRFLLSRPILDFKNLPILILDTFAKHKKKNKLFLIFLN